MVTHAPGARPCLGELSVQTERNKVFNTQQVCIFPTTEDINHLIFVVSVVRMEDLEAAIMELQIVVEATPEGHPTRAQVLDNLGTHLRRRYEGTRKLPDLEAAITQSKAAVVAAPEGHPDRVICLENLATCLKSRYERTNEPEDLKATIALSEEVLESTPEGDPNRAELSWYPYVHAISAGWKSPGPGNRYFSIRGSSRVNT